MDAEWLLYVSITTGVLFVVGVVLFFALLIFGVDWSGYGCA